jgi:hypothetical protein
MLSFRVRKRFLAAAAVLTLHAGWYWRYVSDDAYISLRFAHRLVAGQGLTWTDGERVEGYSNLLWVLACAALHALGIDLVVAARILGLAGMLAALWFLLRARKSLVAALLFAAAGPIAVWTVGGLEAPFEAAFVAWAVYEALERPHRLGIPLAALALTRPDGLLWTGALALALLVVHRTPKILSFALWPLLATLAQLAFRLAYYHEWLPNTAWGKLRPDVASGLAYLKDGALGLSGLLLLAALGLVFAPRRRAIVLAVPLFAWLAYVVSVGGDFMPAHRLLVPAVVLLAFAAGEFVAALDRFGRDGKIRGWLVIAVAGAWFCLAQFHDPENLFARAQTWSSDGVKLGRLLRRGLGDRRPLVALDAAGAIAYASELPALDMLGLCDRWIARHPPPPSRFDMVGHSLGDGDYVLRRQPDIVIFCGPYGGEPCFSGGRRMRDDARFADYQPVTFAGDGFESHVFVRRHGRAGILGDVVPAWLLANVPGNVAQLDGEGRLEALLRAPATVDIDARAAAPDPPDAPVTIVIAGNKLTVTPTAASARLRAIIVH